MQYSSARALPNRERGSIYARPFDLGGTTVDMGNYADVRTTRPDLKSYDNIREHAGCAPFWQQSF